MAEFGLSKAKGSVLLCILCICFAGSVSGSKDGAKTYIIHMQKDAKPQAFVSHEGWYASALESSLAKVADQTLAISADEIISSSQIRQDRLIHVYDTVFHGFAARLTQSEAEELQKMPGVLKLIPEKVNHLHTTYSPKFMNLTSSSRVWRRSWYGSDAIIGIFDTGIWPESKSMSDHKMGPIPSHWKGKCVAGPGFNASLCNKKLIGARYFYRGYEATSGPMNETTEYKSPRDSDGHGTHTASTAGGRYVYGASLLGFAKGTAQGMAPRARIAAYKVCWSEGCFDSDILAAFDQAVADGVDIISLSVGGNVMPYYLDSIALGAFGAMEKGVFVACSSGNEGPSDLSVTNVAPWITTVGASTMDRAFPANVILGNGKILPGVSLYAGPHLGNKKFPLIYASNAPFTKNGSDAYSSSLCMKGSLDPDLVQGKIVVCDRGNNPRVEKGYVVKSAGGVGMILCNTQSDGEGLVADSHLLPAAAVGANAANQVRSYMTSTHNAVAGIDFKGTVFGNKPAPVVASFSSRGPNPETPEILKPDIIAPGVNILAAWTGDAGPTGLAADTRRVKFNIISGTSMACPHVSGLAALLKSAHPDWSPAAIKSALMTTAYLVDNSGSVLLDESTGNVSTPFDFGAGHVDPERALDPGLVYDLEVKDYADFLCTLNYSNKALSLVTRGMFPSCSKKANFGTLDFNYPSFSVVFDLANAGSLLQKSMSRIVTNVGPANSVYKVKVESPRGVQIQVEPEILVFHKRREKKRFKVHVVASKIPLVPGESETVFGLLVWGDGTRSVQSPIAITRQENY